ncbi:superoxide dismutase [Liquorilactobacillus sicerae]|uniref:superoxide dismutase n=1 Tax=Liquorilactobacillus sicerae TaxID=1416943 RepID=UPI0024806872|nr:superoxide dismutase [Liquorilactobacillus sicerae]
MVYILPQLPYDYAALEPYIDRLTMKIHHDRHHQAYVDKLNQALELYPVAKEWSLSQLLGSLAELPDQVAMNIRNNGGGHANHSIFWESLTRDAKELPSPPLLAVITMAFGSFEGFKRQFATTAQQVFGSGWAWLVVDEDGQLAITATANQDSPLMLDQVPLLGLDVWEHAYYLQYQNRRPEYINAFWQIVNWTKVTECWQKNGG